MKETLKRTKMKECFIITNDEISEDSKELATKLREENKLLMVISKDETEDQNGKKKNQD